MPTAGRGRTIAIASVREDVCLDFANTLCWRGSAAPSESLKEFGDLVRWLARSAGVRPASAAAWSHRNPREAEALFARAKAIREAIYSIFSAFAQGTPPRDRDMAVLARALAEAPQRAHLVRSRTGFAWRIEERMSAPALLAPVLWSAGDLVLEAARRRIRLCADARCRWLFIDGSKNGTRRWCDMKSCGNRAKAQRHYAKVKESA